MPSSLSLSLSVSAVQIIHKRRRRGCPSIRRCWKMSLRWSFIDPWKWIRNASTNRYGSSRPRITIIVVGYWIISLSLSPGPFYSKTYLCIDLSRGHMAERMGCYTRFTGTTSWWRFEWKCVEKTLWRMNFTSFSHLSAADSSL